MNEEEKKESPPTTDDSPQQSEQLNNLSAEEPIVQAVETTSEVDQPQTTNYNPETEDMEVHHHTHHEHGKRNWKSYFWEFLMLFLAVFCGFLAEYQLEHVIENSREKQYIISMVKELEADTAQINYVLKDSVRVHGIDSMVRYINTHDFTNTDTRVLYYYKRKYLQSVREMNFSKNTLSQLKNAGNMRLIRMRNVVDSLNRLDNMISEAENQMELVYYHYQFHTLLGTEIFNEWYYYTDSTKNRNFKNEQEFLNQPVAPPLLIKEYQQLLKYANMASLWRGFVRNYHRMLTTNYKFSSELISYIKKEYHLE